MGTEKGGRGIELRKGVANESIRIKFMYRGMECRETLKLPHTKANINYATRLRGEILNAIEKESFKYADYFPDSPTALKFGAGPSRVTVGAILREQMDTAKRTGNLSPSTIAGYKRLLNGHLLKQWDATPVIDVKPPELRAWIGTLTGSIKTVRNILTPLRNVFEQAINDDLIESNPLDRVKLTQIVPRDKQKSAFLVDPFSMAEIEAILANCQGQERNLWQHAFATGMRTSEFIALQWSAIDWVGYRIPVEQVKVAGVIKDYAKTEAGLRKIDMTKGAYDALKAQQAHTKLAGGFVFHDQRYDLPWVGDDPLKKRWARILRKAGVRYRNPYQTRHTFASVLLSAGQSPLYVAKQMGHRDTEMITRHYGRWIEQGNDEETRQRLSAFFAKFSPTSAASSI